jgi:hypothetical protein
MAAAMVARLQAVALHEAGDHEAALVAVDEAVTRARSVNAGFELALGLSLRAALTGNADDAAESDRLLAGLHVVRAPHLQGN